MSKSNHRPPGGAAEHHQPRLHRRMLGVVVIAMIMLLSVACVSQARSPVSANQKLGQSLSGSWAYAQSCGWQHSASLELQPAPDGGMRGQWSDGTRVTGESGELKGDIRNGKLLLRFCRSDVEKNHPGACPIFGAQTAYVVRSGDKLLWYRQSAKNSRRYLTLHRVIEGKEIPKDDRCPDEK